MVARATRRKPTIDSKFDTRKNNFTSSLGEMWNISTVKNILNNYSYIGKKEVNKGNKNKNQDELKSFEKYQIVSAS